ncbi:hypothetical protein Kpho02_34220 [Kitasatospora phosalacinea]|uniref:Uncharacterized protein n=1 Tax=Kitasatospora phosalacinea TaxID=2065 RepID=A0A9W6QA08_9ACTN|nr:hypothetical protein [Kitasatospora phosalacinea]GLW71123.1 hypothetical protein Kpho02_34220 [Kitasatospora phosalacinea]
MSGRSGGSRERRTHGPDRTKTGATPRRGAARRPTGRRLPPALAALLGALLALAGLALGVGVLIGSGAAMAEVRAEHRLPELRMTVTDCRTTGESRSLSNHCRGTGDPGGTDVTPGPWRYDGAPLDYRAGTVADVRCTADGSCTRLGVGDHVLTLVAGLGGLLLTGAALTGLTTTLLGAFAPSRAAALRRPRTVRAGAAAAAATLVLAAAGSLLYMLT